MLKWQYGAMTKCHNDKMPPWQTTTMTMPQGKMPQGQNAIMKKCHNDKMLQWQCHKEKMPQWKNATRTKPHIDKMLKWQKNFNGKLTKY